MKTKNESKFGGDDMSAHTPGPWSVEIETTGCGDFSIESVSYHVAQTMGGMRNGVEEANARLIAAAPELLEALIDLERTSGRPAMYDDPCRVKARAIIAKAAGVA